MYYSNLTLTHGKASDYLKMRKARKTLSATPVDPKKFTESCGGAEKMIQGAM